MKTDIMIATGKTFNIGGLLIKEVITTPCYRLTQYGKGLPITCNCKSCKVRNQTPEEAKAGMDLLYKYAKEA